MAIYRAIIMPRTKAAVLGPFLMNKRKTANLSLQYL